MAEKKKLQDYYSDFGSSQEEQTENYYQMAQDQRYKDLLSQEIQLENAKRNAMRYTQAQANNQGFAGTGYGSSMGMSAQNAYLNALGSARNDYNQDVMALNQQKRTDMNNIYADRVSGLMNNVASTDNMDDLNEYMSANGIEIDGDGNPIKPSWMRDEDWSAFLLNYRQTTRGLSQSAEASSTASTPERFRALSYTGHNGKTESLGYFFDYETQRMQSLLSDGSIAAGEYVMLNNGSGDRVFVKYDGNGGLSVVEFDDIPDDATVHRIDHKPGKKTNYQVSSKKKLIPLVSKQRQIMDEFKQKKGRGPRATEIYNGMVFDGASGYWKKL